MKNFACDLCEKKFIDSYKLRRHLKTHTSGRNQPQAVVATSVEVTSTPTVTSYAMIQGKYGLTANSGFFAPNFSHAYCGLFFLLHFSIY